MRSTTLADDRLDLVFRALADRTRRSLLDRLTRGPARITDLAKPFEMSLAGVSKHLRVLERAGLIHREIEGRVHECALSAEPLEDVAEWVARYRVFWDGTLASLAAYVEGEQDS